MTFATEVMLQLSTVIVYLLTTTGFIVLGEVRILESAERPHHLQRRPGDQVDVACRSTDASPVEWLHEDRAVESPSAAADDDRRRHLLLTRNLTADGSFVQLTIFNAQLNDSGWYKCRNKRRHAENDQLMISITSDETDAFYSYQDFKVEIVEPLDSVLTVDAGASFNLRCVGYNGAQLDWYHNGTQLAKSRQVIITSSRQLSEQRQISLLTRSGVSDPAAGTYECRDLYRSYLGDNVTIRIHRPERTKVPVEIIQPPSKLNRIRVGASFEIKCRSNASSDLVWFHNETQRLHDNRETVVIIGSLDRAAQLDTSTLRLSNVTTQRNGKYSCRSLKDSSDNDYVMVVVVGGGGDDSQDSGSNFENGTPPTVPTSVIMQIGSITNLQCSFQAPGDYRLEWTKDNKVLINGEKYIILQDSKTISLGIRFTDRSDVGIYKCTFKRISSNKTAGVVVFNVTTILCPSLEPPDNGHLVQCPAHPVFGESCGLGCNHGYQISNSTPVVCERKPTGETYWSKDLPECTAYTKLISDESEVPTTMSNVLLRIGSSLKLQCGQSTVWTKRNRSLRNGTKYAIEENALTIHDIDRNDAGIYDCSIYKDDTLIGMNKFNVTLLACPKHPLLPHGAVAGCSDEPVFGEICVFRCHAGYTLQGNRLRSCELTGNETVPYWTGDAAECLSSPEGLISPPNSATSNNIPAKLCIFERVGIVRFHRQGILTVALSAILLIPHFLRW